MLGAIRSSPSPSKIDREEYRRFAMQDDHVTNERGVMSEVVRFILGNRDIPHQMEVEFDNLLPLTDASLVNAKPGLYDGTRNTYKHRDLRGQLNVFIVPSMDSSLPCIPSFFLEVKGPEDSPVVAKRQIIYDGALGARAIQKVRMHQSTEEPFDGNAYTISATYLGGTGLLTLYTTHPVHSNDANRAEDYNTARLASFALRRSFEEFREGVTALRNAGDWAAGQRENILSHANNRLRNSDAKRVADNRASGRP